MIKSNVMEISRLTMEYTQLEHEKRGRAKTSFRILSHLRFQKFRYHGENRPGKKNQRKEFMKIEISNVQGACVRVCIICVDADVQDKVKVHPNGLIGRNCHHGLYDMRCPVPANNDTFEVVIPYIRIERMKSKKENKETIIEAMKTRMSYLPSPYKEHFASQCPAVACARDVDTAKLRLAVIVSAEGSSAGVEKPLSISNVIKDGCQNTSLDILKLSQNHLPASSGACVDIFTTESSPAIKPGEYKVYVTYQPPGASGKLEHWISQETTPGEDCIIYNKVISYKVPSFEPDLFLKSPVKATLHLDCPDSDLSCSCPFYYVPERGCSEFIELNDREEMDCIRLSRKQSVKRSRCESIDDSEIAASLRIKPIGTGTATGQIQSNGVAVPEPELHPLTIDKQKSKAQILSGTNSESQKTLHLPPAGDIEDSKSSDNIWMRSTSAHHDNQTAVFPGTSVKTEDMITKTQINIADYQPTGPSTFGLFSSDNPAIEKQQITFSNGIEVASRVQSIPSCTVQRPDFRVEMGIASRVHSKPSCSVKRPGCNVTIIPGYETKPMYTNSQDVLSNDYQFVPRSAALQQKSHQFSCTSPSFQNRTEKDMSQNSIGNQHTAVGLTGYENWQQETAARPRDSYRTCWGGQKHTGKCVSEQEVDIEKAQAVSDIIKYLKDTQQLDTDNCDLGQISCDFLTNPDYCEANSMNQVGPTATSDHAGAYTTSFNLETLDLFAETATNLSTMDLLKCLNDNY